MKKLLFLLLVLILLIPTVCAEDELSKDDVQKILKKIDEWIKSDKGTNKAGPYTFEIGKNSYNYNGNLDDPIITIDPP